MLPQAGATISRPNNQLQTNGRRNDTMKTYTVNARGIEEIRQFLKENHKKGDHFTRDMLNAWAQEAEFQLGEGNPPATIEIRAHNCINGYTMEYRISDAGLDATEHDDED